MEGKHTMRESGDRFFVGFVRPRNDDLVGTFLHVLVPT
jgi:hypothetical protein